MASVFKENQYRIRTLTDYDMLLMVEEGIRGGICHSIQQYAKANNKYTKGYNNNEESSYIQYLDTLIIFMVGQCLKNYQQTD